jgi:hypothetical protein
VTSLLGRVVAGPPGWGDISPYFARVPRGHLTARRQFRAQDSNCPRCYRPGLDRLHGLPLYELSALVRAIDARDVSTVARYVNFDRVRASLTEQIASGYIRRSGVQPGPLAQQAIVVGLSVADPVIRKLVSPEALSELLAVGWPVAVVPDPPPGTLGLNSGTLGSCART